MQTLNSQEWALNFLWAGLETTKRLFSKQDGSSDLLELGSMKGVVTKWERLNGRRPYKSNAYISLSVKKMMVSCLTATIPL